MLSKSYLVVLNWDSTDIALQKLRNHHFQKRTFSTKSNQNCLHKYRTLSFRKKLNKHSISRLEACDAGGIIVYTTLLSVSISPNGTDESVSFHNVNTESGLGINGGMARVFCGLPEDAALGLPGYRVVNLIDKGFK